MSIRDMRAKGIRVTGNSTYKKEKIKIVGDSVTISNKPIGDIPFIYVFDDKEIDKIIAIEQDFKVKNRTIFFPYYLLFH